MQLTTNGKQHDVGDALRGYIEERVSAVFRKYFENSTDGHVTLCKLDKDIRAYVTFHIGKGIPLQGHAMAGDAQVAFGETTEHIGTRLRRYKRRLRDHHWDWALDTDTFPTWQYVFDAEAEVQLEEAGPEPNQPVIVTEMETVLEKLTPGNAAMRMDSADLPALMFRNITNGGIDMIYRRAGGYIGCVISLGSRGGVPEGN